jgi:hypothetical protein
MNRAVERAIAPARSAARTAKGFARHVVADVRRGAGPSHLATDLGRLGRRFAAGVAISTPPHPLGIYERCLARLAADPRCRVVPLPAYVGGRGLDPEAVNVVLRHDLDSGDAVAAAALCDADRRAGFRSSVHVLVDGVLYDPAPLAALLAGLHRDGFDVGLHTQAWMHADPRAALRDDLDRFERLLGFRAQTMTFHGAWPRTGDDLARRRRFGRELEADTGDASLAGYCNWFDFVAEDSNVAGRPQPLSSAFLEVPSRCYLGGVALVLTHDTHWQARER